MSYQPGIVISGVENGHRVDSRILEERIQQAVSAGHRMIEVQAYGQHGIGGRLWKAGKEPVNICITGTSGQRVGSMGSPNTSIDVMGPVSDDAGWLNAGAHIVVHGNAANGVGNAMAQGRIYAAGNIGARGMTMTKHNPDFDPPQLWVLGGAGDSFAEFMAGGIAVVCGHQAQNPENILGHRPCVGMVGGRIFFRGAHKGYSENNARLLDPDDDDWQWLTSNMRDFLDAVNRLKLLSRLISDRSEWRLLVARDPREKVVRSSRPMSEFLREVWDKELGKGGLVGDISTTDRSPIPVIATGGLRRYIPVWENHRYQPPCQYNCPTGMPAQRRWELIRGGKISEAVDLALEYTPFPATVCGYLCPNLCMENCTRAKEGLGSLDIGLLGRTSLKAGIPGKSPPTGKKIAIIGGGPAGLSAAWQLWLRGHQPVVYEMNEQLGGKITDVIPASRIPGKVAEDELNRLRKRIEHVHLKHPVGRAEFSALREEYDFLVIATGARKPRMIPVPGSERAIAALDFLRLSKMNLAEAGKRVVVIGAGNVGCDAAAEAARLGATDITLIDIQEPASFGTERRNAEAAGARFLWPRFCRAITCEGVELEGGEILPADTVIVSTGDRPDLSFLPEDIETERGFIVVSEQFQTGDPHVFAIGDTVRPGLLTEAVGAGREAAATIDSLLTGEKKSFRKLPQIDPARVKLEYYDPRVAVFDDISKCAEQCASCGVCRDCGLCEAICPENAISRRQLEGEDYEYISEPERCIGCGFCDGACPCGIWRLVENEPFE